MGGSKDLATEVDDLLEGVRLFLVPTANPDGFTQTGIWQRENSRGVDLNRNFPGMRVRWETLRALGMALLALLLLCWVACTPPLSSNVQPALARDPASSRAGHRLD